MRMQLTQPVVDPKIRKPVPNSHVGPSELVAEEHQSREHEADTEITEDDLEGVPVVIQRAAGIEVVDSVSDAVGLANAAALALLLVVVVASDVGHQVVGPANQLLSNQHDQGVDGRVLRKLANLLSELAEFGRLLFPGARHENHVALDVASGFVVLAVAHLPAEVGHKKGRVEDPAHHVVERLGRREGLVAALVGKDPQTGAEETLEDGVQTPEHNASSLGWDYLGRDIVVEDVEGHAQVDHVAEDMHHTPEAGTLEAVLGNGIPDVLDGEVGHLELVAVCVQQLSVTGLLCRGVAFRHGGERCRRRGMARRVEGRDVGR
jgi:hypothetical protein